MFHFHLRFLMPTSLLSHRSPKIPPSPHPCPPTNPTKLDRRNFPDALAANLALQCNEDLECTAMHNKVRQERVILALQNRRYPTFGIFPSLLTTLQQNGLGHFDFIQRFFVHLISIFAGNWNKTRKKGMARMLL